jgi:tRNA A37 threonylcarbamoyladenosine biosynthesis protein TsaE
MKKNTYIFIEWPEIAEALLPKERKNVTIVIKNEQTRSLTI